MASIGGLGKEPGQFRGPSKVFVSGTNGLLVVCDMFNFRVQTFRDLEPDKMFGSYGNSVTQFSRVIAAAEEDYRNHFGHLLTQAKAQEAG